MPWISKASSAYAEHDGVKRHGDGRPTNSRWYQRTSCIATVGFTFGFDTATELLSSTGFVTTPLTTTAVATDRAMR